MAKANWIISGDGGQAVTYDAGSMRCVLSGSKLMLWNGRTDLANSDVVALIKMQNTTNSRGGLVLRSSISGLDCYRLRIYGPRTYYIQKTVSGIVTTLTTVVSSQPYNYYVKTRFRADGYQISIEEFVGGIWNLVGVAEDTEHSVASGYAGLYGESANTSYYITFDDVAISEG